MALNRSRLFTTTMFAGVAALAVTAALPAAAQTQAPPQTTQTAPEPTGPTTAQPNPADQAAGADESLAQTDDVVGEGTEVDAVIVTGSRIRRSPVNAPAPLIQLGREEVLQSGEPNVVDFLADIPALQTSVVPEDTTGSNLNDGGLSLLNLRNLGTARTLTLVDGRRHVGSVPNGQQVDVDTIPTLLIQNVEVVTGGQSALYGADAVAGVVNFILRRNFDGIEVDAALAEINDNGELNGRVSALVGRNFMDDRLNVYAFGEYQRSEEVLDLDMDWRRRAYALAGNDADPGNQFVDGDFDVALVENARDAFFARGGIFVLSNSLRPSSPGSGIPFLPGSNLISDPDNTVLNCGATPANRGGSQISSNCYNIQPQSGFNTVYTFNRDGTIRPFNFGSFQARTGNNRRLNVNGDGLNTGTEFGQGSRLPESEAYRFQAGVNYRITPDIQFFAEAKFVREETYDAGQPTFFQQNAIADVNANTLPGFFSSASFNIGLDNPFLDPVAVNLIRNNVRQVYDLCQFGTRLTTTVITTSTCVVPGTTTAANAGNAGPNPNFGALLGTVPDARAFFGFFGPSRSQFNERELQRYVIGLRGDRDTLGFINNFSWELGYTYGRVENQNEESALDVERFVFAVDAVRNAAGQIVCRASDLAARGINVPDRVGRTDLANLLPTDPTLTGCTPINVFGTDFRADANHPNATGGGGRPGLTDAQKAYVLASITVEDTNEQQDFVGFASGELWDLWGAGPIGLAVGYEYREETTSGIGRDRDTAGRFLFLNTGPDFPEVSYDVSEFFGELRVPLLTDRPFVQTLEVSGAYRYSDYSSFGETNTYSAQGLYRPTEDILFRATYGRSVRAPSLGEAFDPGGQTFANGLVDPCDATNLRNLADPVLRANRIANCQALLGGSYDPNTTPITYTQGVPGTLGGNPNISPEESRSYTFSVALTPRFLPNFSLVFDYYNIRIEQAIQFPTTQQNLNACVSSVGLNPTACGVLTRNGFIATGDANNFRLVDFFQGPLNFAQSRTQGVDFTARYNFDLDYFDFMPRNAGRIDYALRGNYLIRSEDLVNIQDPTDITENDSLQGQPRVRFLQTITYSPTDRLSLTWDWDWQSSQEIFDNDLLTQNPDSRPVQFYETGDFHQHDFSVRYQVRDDLTLRAGVVNAFDEEPVPWLTSTTTSDNFDLFGRRFYVGFNFRR